MTETNGVAQSYGVSQSHEANNQMVLLDQAHALMLRMAGELSTDLVWKSTPLGHTPFQIERFILNDAEFPEAHGAKFRQCVRELWARWGAYWQVKDGLDDLAVEHDRQTFLARWSLLPWGRQKARLQLERIARKTRELHLDLEHRIMPETEHFLRIASKCAPDDAKVFEFAEEWKVWKHRAGSQPKLKELIGREPLGG